MPHKKLYNTINAEFEHNSELIDRELIRNPTAMPKAATTDNMDRYIDLPPATINLGKAIWFLERCLTEGEYLRIRPPSLIKHHTEMFKLPRYTQALKQYLKDMEHCILYRARQITSTMVLSHIKTEAFKSICKSSTNHILLESFFFQNVTDEQLYYIFGPVWTAVDFSWVQGSDIAPPADATHTTKIKWDLRMFTKKCFAFFAMHHFADCLQKKGDGRHDSTQPTEQEKRAITRNLRRLSDSTKRGEKKCKAAEDKYKNNVRTEGPSGYSKPVVFRNPFDNSAEIETGSGNAGMLHDEEIADAKRFNEGVKKEIDRWGTSPLVRFIEEPGMLPAASNFRKNDGLTRRGSSHF